MEFAIIQLLVFLLLATVDIGTAVYDRYWRHLQQNIGYVAHLAGAVAGKIQLIFFSYLRFLLHPPKIEYISRVGVELTTVAFTVILLCHCATPASSFSFVKCTLKIY